MSPRSFSVVNTTNPRCPSGACSFIQCYHSTDPTCSLVLSVVSTVPLIHRVPKVRALSLIVVNPLIYPCPLGTGSFNYYCESTDPTCLLIHLVLSVPLIQRALSFSASYQSQWSIVRRPPRELSGPGSRWLMRKRKIKKSRVTVALNSKLSRSGMHYFIIKASSLVLIFYAILTVAWANTLSTLADFLHLKPLSSVAYTLYLSPVSFGLRYLSPCQM